MLNGLLVTRIKLPPFIVTLGTLNIFFALNLYISQSETVRGRDMSSLLLWTGNAFEVGGARVTYGAILMLLLFALMAFVLKWTMWGRHVYATGDDREAARLSGIRTDRVLLSVYVVAGLIYAIGAWILIGRIASASPQAGITYNLDTITAVVIGGTSLFGGRGRILGTLLGCPDRRRVPKRPAARRDRRALAELRRRRPGARRRRDRPMDPEGSRMTTQDAPTTSPVLAAKGLVKRYGNVTALNGADFELYPGEILAVIGDNGAGKSTLIKCLTGAEVPDAGTIWLGGEEVLYKNPLEARKAGIETVYQTLAVSPSLDISSNLFLGRERRRSGSPAASCGCWTSAG